MKRRWTAALLALLLTAGLTAGASAAANRKQIVAYENYAIAIKLDGEVFSGPVIYTGQADELFGFRFGPLPYRTLDFGFETLPQDVYQTHGTVNYTADQPYTRITEFKLLTGQALPGVTTIMKEYSRAYTGEPGETPYYAIINPENNALYSKYQADARKIPNLHLLGRLAEYKYYNMDAITAKALALANTL